MSDPLLEVAIKSLELMGMPINDSTRFLIELLWNAGEDVLVAFPRIVRVAESVGLHALEEVANGMAFFGPVGFVEKLINDYTRPYIEKAQTVQNGKTQLTAYHRQQLLDIQTQLIQLTTSSGYQAPSATAMVENFAKVQTETHKLLDAMDQSRQIDRDLQGDLEGIATMVTVMVIVDLIIFAIVFVVVFVGTALVLLVPAAAGAPETGGFTLALDPVAGLVAGGAAVGGIATELLPAEGLVIIGALIYAFGRWAIRHSMLSIAISWQQSHVLHMSKGGKQKVSHTGIENEARALIASGLASDMCDALGKMMDAARRAKDSQKRERIKATEKQYRCRHRGGG